MIASFNEFWAPIETRNSCAALDYIPQVAPGGVFCYGIDKTKVLRNSANAAAYCTAAGADYVAIVHSSAEHTALRGAR